MWDWIVDVMLIAAGLVAGYGLTTWWVMWREDRRRDVLDPKRREW
jgi:hypothetical protein